MQCDAPWVFNKLEANKRFSVFNCILNVTQTLWCLFMLYRKYSVRAHPPSRRPPPTPSELTVYKHFLIDIEKFAVTPCNNNPTPCNNNL